MTRKKTTILVLCVALLAAIGGYLLNPKHPGLHIGDNVYVIIPPDVPYEVQQKDGGIELYIEPNHVLELVNTSRKKRLITASFRYHDDRKLAPDDPRALHQTGFHPCGFEGGEKRYIQTVGARTALWADPVTFKPVLERP